MEEMTNNEFQILIDLIVDKLEKNETKELLEILKKYQKDK